MNTKEQRRVGIFGGSFDPVHLGHLLVAQAAREELGLDRLFFVPAAQSPFKPERQPLAGPERARLLRLALAGQEWCEIDEQELRRAGPSYTVDTIQEYTRRFPQAELWYILGADHAPQLPKWREAETLARLVQFAMVGRPGEPQVPLPTGFRGRMLAGVPLGLSSSQIRERIRAGLSIEHLMPAAVAEAIRNNRLYL